MVDHIILAAGVDAARAFIEDVTVVGTCEYWYELWTSTVCVLHKLAHYRFMINLRKRNFC